MKPADRAYALALSLLCVGISNTRAEIIAATHLDYSGAGYVPPVDMPEPEADTPASQVPFNGFSYGIYPPNTGTTGTFSFAGIFSGTEGGEPFWRGNDGANTPGQSRFDIHPGLSGSASVRRYTVSSQGEPLLNGPVRVVGRFFELNNGFTHVFLAVDPDGDGSEPSAPRSVVVPATGPSVEVTIPNPIPFDVTVNVSPGATIDFGALPMGDAYSDSTGLIAWIVDGNTAVPTNLVSSPLGSVNFPFFNNYQDLRALCYGSATDTVTGGTDATTFELTGGGYPYQYAGLLYLENDGSGKATRFDSVRIDVTAANDFPQAPQLFLLRHNADPGPINPVEDDRYERLPVQAVRHAANATGQPYYTFDLSTLPASLRAGYGFAVLGSSANNSTPVAVSEISAVAHRVSASEVVPTTPFFVEWTNGHRYGISATRGTWEQVQAEAVAAGAHLATFGTPENPAIPYSVTDENNFVAQTFTDPEDPEGFYIGLKQNHSSTSYSEPAGGWEWVNGDSYAPDRWDSPEPNQAFGPGEDYGWMLITTENPNGAWYDISNKGYPETSNYRGIVEIDSPGAGERNFSVPSIHGRSNIFDAGLGSPTQGGMLPPSINLTGLDGKVLRFPKIHGTFNTAADYSGPDGAHTPGRSCDLTAVGGISGYLNGNNTPALVGVFLGSGQPSTPPARLDFSTGQIGENFTSLAPALGQIFFIGDGLTSDGVAQQFTIPAGAEKLYFGYPDGHTGELYHGIPLGWGDNSGSLALRASIAPDPVPAIGLTFPISGGQLQVSGGTGPFTFSLLSGALPPGLTLSPSGVVAGTPGNGPYNFIVKVTDANGATANRSFSGTLENPIPVPDSLVSWWAAENTLADIVGNNHGSMKNGPIPGYAQPGGQSYGPGKAGRALVFDGANDFIQIAHDPSQNLTGDLTIEGWIKPTANSASEPTIIGKRSGDNSFCTYVLYLKAGGELAFASRNGGTWNDVATPAPVTLNQWSHVAVTLGGGQLRFYVNGIPVHSAGYATERPAVTAPLTIGATITDSFPESNPSGSFPGSIDELAIYSRALSALEISALHLSGTGGKAHHDITRDFSLITNPAGAWSYRRQLPDALSGTYNPGAAALMGSPAADGPLAFCSNASSVTFNTNESYYWRDSGGTKFDWLGHQFGMGPSPGSDYAVLRWTAPVSGQYAVSANFFGADTQPTTVDVHVFHNATELTPAGKRYLNTYRGDGVAHTQLITVNADDTVDFLVGSGGNGYAYDTTSLAASVTLLSVTPLPQIVAEQPAGSALTDGDSTVSYGPVTLGASVTKTITLRNTGTAPLTGLAATVDGTDAAKFVAPVSLSSSTLAPGASLTFDVTFTPAVSGAHSAVLHIASNDSPRSPFDIALSGSGYSAVGNKVFAWGDNIAGALGDGTASNRNTPVPVIMTGALASQSVTSVVTGNARSHAITVDGKVYSWGANDSGQLGDGTTISSPQPVAVDMSGALAGKTVTALSVNHVYTLALTTDGKVYSWGANFGGQLGLGDTADRSSPQLVQGALAGKTIVSISAGSAHAMALASDGTVYGWGNNLYRTLGDGTTATRLSPVAMNTTGTLLEGKTITAIQCASYHNVVLTSEGKLYSWGFNGNGKLGDGTIADRPAPVAVNGSLEGKTVVAISGSFSHHLALTSDNQLHGWGYNLYGQIGNGTNADENAPVLVPLTGALAGKTIASFEAGSATSLLTTTDGEVFTWGFNLTGQLGNGGTADSNVPVALDMGGALAGRTLVAAAMQDFHGLVIAYAPPAPEIVVENEAGTPLIASEVYRQEFGPVLPNKHRTAFIKIRNTGDNLLGDIGITIDGPGATDFSVASDRSGTTLTPGDVETLSITFSPTSLGTREATLHITSDDTDEPAYTVVLAGFGAQPVTEWREQFFATTENAGDAADEADPDGDGVTNLLEFATGADPTDGSVVETPVSPPVAGLISFTYTRNKLAAAEVIWSVQWTDALDGAWSSNGVSETVIADDGTLETVVATLPGGPDGKRFVHLKVTRP